MTDRWGLFEHAAFRVPRREHGYCTDDVARALTVVSREHSSHPELARLTGTYLAFLERAVVADGSVHNRMNASGEWMDAPAIGDWWGRAIGGLGSAVSHTRDADIHRHALAAFHRAAQKRSTDVRASSFAVTGAALVLRVHPGDRIAEALLSDSLDRIPRRSVGGWDWIEPRLRYANGALCDALIVGGEALGEPETVEQGLAALAALLVIETGPDDVLSVTGNQGRGPGDRGPLWDQQPIEPAAIADASIHAAAITGDDRWLRGVLLAWDWFIGDNDAGTAMYDPALGVGYDGLESGGRNENCGAESTLAALSTVQHRRTMALVTT